MSKNWSHYRPNVRRKQKQDANQLSQREQFADEIHDILRDLKQEVKQTKELQRKWQDDDTRESVEDDYKYHARQIVKQAEALRRRLGFPSENVKELNEISRLKANIRSLENRLKEAGRFDDQERPFSSNSRETREDSSFSKENENYSREEIPVEQYSIQQRKAVPCYSEQGDSMERKGKSERLLNKQDGTAEKKRRQSSDSADFNIKDSRREPVQSTGSLRREPKLEALRNDLETMTAEKACLEDAYRSLVKEKQQLVEKIQTQNTKVADIEYENKRLRESEERSQLKLVSLTENLSKLETKLNEQKTLLDNKDRKLTSNNEDFERDESDELYREDIDEISDPNRPMKLAEKVSELYDNQWTNAMENLEDLGLDDDRSIQLLLEIFTESYRSCSEAGDRQLAPILSGHYLALPDIENVRARTPIENMNLDPLSTEISKPLKDYRKLHCEKADQYIAQVMIEKFKKMPGFDDKIVKACEVFIQHSVRYTWMMVVQDPPVHMEWKFHHGDEFDNNRLRSYTKGGKYLDFMVWPVLYLHEGGPLLAKGVAQGMKHKN